MTHVRAVKALNVMVLVYWPSLQVTCTITMFGILPTRYQQITTRYHNNIIQYQRAHLTHLANMKDHWTDNEVLHICKDSKYVFIIFDICSLRHIESLSLVFLYIGINFSF